MKVWNRLQDTQGDYVEPFMSWLVILPQQLPCNTLRPYSLFRTFHVETSQKPVLYKDFGIVRHWWKSRQFLDGNPTFNLWTDFFYMWMDDVFLNQEKFEQRSGLGKQKHHEFSWQSIVFFTAVKKNNTQNLPGILFLLWHLLAHRSFKKRCTNYLTATAIGTK